MEQPIERVDLVSDGLLVAFSDGTRCYFPAAFLMSQVGLGSNQIFLDYDPSLGAPADFVMRDFQAQPAIGLALLD